MSQVLAAQTGVFVVHDAQQVDTAWARDSGSGGWVIDFEGPGAEQMARGNANSSPTRGGPTGGASVRPPDVVQLDDGTWRLHLPDQRIAATIAARANAPGLKATCHGLGTSRDVARDLTRKAGAGTNGHMVAIYAPKGLLFEEKLDAAGRVIEVVLKAVQ